jgi:ubiquinone/menaquinone biosynthesis C-methylase UbiE
VLEENTHAIAYWEQRGYRRGLHRRDDAGRLIISLRKGKPGAVNADAQLDQVKAQFGATAAGYATSVGHARGDELSRIAELVAGPVAERKALDIATGAGHTAFAVAPYVREVIATDVTPEMLLQTQAGAISRGLDNVETASADAHALPYPDNTFAIVTSRIAPHHFSALPLAVREIARVTQPGGLVIVVDSVVPEDPDLDAFLNHVEKLRDPSHVRSRTETEWRQLFEDNNLAIIAAERYPHTHDYADWVARALVPADEQPALEAAFLKASNTAKAAYTIQISDGHVVSYTDDKLLIAGRKI